MLFAIEPQASGVYISLQKIGQSGPSLSYAHARLHCTLSISPSGHEDHPG